jgi:uncharacterized protein YuzE
MKRTEYYSETDSMYINISSRKSYYTVEFSSRIGVDATQSGTPVGIEILEASKWLSDLFGRIISKDDIKHLLCNVTGTDSIIMDLEIDDQKVKYALPLPYHSPLLSA